MASAPSSTSRWSTPSLVGSGSKHTNRETDKQASNQANKPRNKLTKERTNKPGNKRPGCVLQPLAHASTRSRPDPRSKQLTCSPQALLDSVRVGPHTCKGAIEPNQRRSAAWNPTLAAIPSPLIESSAGRLVGFRSQQTGKNGGLQARARPGARESRGLTVHQPCGSTRAGQGGSARV